MASTTSSEIIPFLQQDDTQALIERNSKTGWPDMQAYQKAFAYSFLIHFDHRRAATEAGRSPDSGLSILRHPLVAAFIEAEQQKQATCGYITKEYIVTQYMNLIPMLMGEVDTPTMLANGATVYGRQFRPAELKGVLQELSKTVDGFDRNKTVGGGKGGVTINLDLGSLVGDGGIDRNNGSNIIVDGEIADGEFEEA